jgi:hypothetical protein
MRQKKKIYQKLLSWSSVLPVAIFLTSCNSVIVAEERFSFELSQHPVFFLVFIFLLFLQMMLHMVGILAFDGNIREFLLWIFFGYTNDDLLDRMLTRPVKFLIPLWLIFYPIGFFYFKYLNALPSPLIGFPNVDLILFRIIVPVFFLGLMAFAIQLTRVFSNSFFIFRWLWFGWYILVPLTKFTCVVGVTASFVLWIFRR